MAYIETFSIQKDRNWTNFFYTSNLTLEYNHPEPYTYGPE